MAGAAPSRFIPRVVDVQGARELFDGTGHWTKRWAAIRVVSARLLHHDAQGLGLTHLNFEGGVVKFKVGPFELEFSGLHQA